MVKEAETSETGLGGGRTAGYDRQVKRPMMIQGMDLQNVSRPTPVFAD